MEIDTMTNEKKLTKVQKFEIIANLDGVKTNEMLSEFIAREIELLKASNANRKPTATQKANQVLTEAIVEFMTAKAEEKYTISDLLRKCEACAGLSNQKVTAIMRHLCEAKQVEKVIEKRVSYFQIKQ